MPAFTARFSLGPDNIVSGFHDHGPSSFLTASAVAAAGSYMIDALCLRTVAFAGERWQRFAAAVSTYCAVA